MLFFFTMLSFFWLTLNCRLKILIVRENFGYSYKEIFDSLNDLKMSILEEYKLINNLSQSLPGSKKAHVYIFVMCKLGSVFDEKTNI